MAPLLVGNIDLTNLTIELTVVVVRYKHFQRFITSKILPYEFIHSRCSPRLSEF